jgi:hypothetical protein
MGWAVTCRTQFCCPTKRAKTMPADAICYRLLHELRTIKGK